jgi:hypothetical protein
MHFLEKDLETIIFENYEACFNRGLQITDIGAGDYLNQLKFRQLQLGPYGIADLVNVRYDARGFECTIQVIECKRNEINTATYGQAKRYFAAIKNVLKHFLPESHAETEWIEELVLIGRTFDHSNDFAYIYNADNACQAFTYSYEVDGIWFKQIDRDWQRDLKDSQAVVKPLAQAVYDMMRATERYDAEQDALRASEQLEQGDATKPLLITPTGILLNTELLERRNNSPYTH